jgi:hypothetical protein
MVSKNVKEYLADLNPKVQRRRTGAPFRVHEVGDDFFYRIKQDPEVPPHIRHNSHWVAE